MVVQAHSVPTATVPPFQHAVINSEMLCSSTQLSNSNVQVGSLMTVLSFYFCSSCVFCLFLYWRITAFHLQFELLEWISFGWSSCAL